MQFKEKFEISVCCPKCKHYHSVYVERNDYWSWIRRKGSIQTIFSYLTAPEREIILTGTCPSCWNEIFKEE